ncbi:hypothetical protein BR93DRAFT_961666 [Coniochaeta sp. PMI_546]|nr:hypothetical protein BR93DRAFT_961666 [Coniochaeta sp. PMI_546]
MSDTLLLDTEAVGHLRPSAQSAANYHESEENLLEEHWDCFDGPSCFASHKPLLKSCGVPEGDQSKDLTSLKAGEVYNLLDFCCHRVPAWYRSEVNRILQLVETKNTQVTSDGAPCNSGLLEIWESSYKQHLEQRSRPADTTATTPSIIVTIATPVVQSFKTPPTRVQPPRKGKRKVAELEDVRPRVIVKRRKIAKAKGAAGGKDTSSTDTYHIAKSAFGSALHLSLPSDDDLHGRICHRSFRSFRNRLIAKVTSKIMGIYSRRAAEGNKTRRCVLQGHETASPWCRTGKRTTEAYAGEAVVVGVPAAPEPEMLASPSCANWPPPAKSRTQMAREDVGQNAVEFEGLKFLVDVCGDPPVPRVMML